MNPIELSIFSRKMDAVCEEMGAHLQLAAFSPNIRDRLDYSCAVFDAEGGLCAQAAHIPVHLGSMAYAMQRLVKEISWHARDVLIINDPFLGGTHLPDVTLISPVFVEQQLLGFVANRAHHADIGSDAPGSMPISSRLEDEGIVITPTLIGSGDKLHLKTVTSMFSEARNHADILGDITAQNSANQLGISRLQEIIATFTIKKYLNSLCHLNMYGERIARAVISKIPNGRYSFTDVMDDDGQGNFELPITVCIKIDNDYVEVDFSGTCEQVSGNINCPLSVTAAAVLYVFRCLMPKQTPACKGSFLPIKIIAPEGSLVNAKRPAAVAAGNVETSSRIVDVILGALSQSIPDQIPACSQGTMNNLALGNSGTNAWGYYETIAGGMGASKYEDGLSAVQSHMTNTQNTPAEVLEMTHPIRIQRYAIRKNSGGNGIRRGGDGLIREFLFMNSARFTILSERRKHTPWGLHGANSGQFGKNFLNDKELPAKVHCLVKYGDVLRIETPGGGGWGLAN